MNNIIKIGFEPVAFVAVAGAILFWLTARNKPWAAFWLGMTALAVLWRGVLGIDSSRYAELLCLPFIFGTAFFCARFPPWLSERFPVLSRWNSHIARGCLWIMLVMCMCAILHINPYASYIIDMGRSIRKDAETKGRVLLLVPGKEVDRIAYYTGIRNVRSYAAADISARDLRHFLQSYRTYRMPIYLVLPSYSSGTPPPTARELGLDDREWRQIFCGYASRRQRKTMYVFCIERQNAGPLREVFAGAPSVLLNGDFEKSFSEPEKKALYSSYLQPRKFFWFHASSDGTLPAYWIPYAASEPVGDTTVFIEKRNPISGNGSLRFRGIEPVVVSNQGFFHCVDSTISFTCRGTPGSEFCLELFPFDAGFKALPSVELAHFAIQKTERRDEVIPLPAEILEKAFRFRFGIRFYRGDITIDDIRMTQGNPGKK